MTLFLSQRKGKSMNIVAKSFTPTEFTAYIQTLALPSLPKGSWKPSFIVLHNTGTPTLDQRPLGLTASHIQNLKSYYEGLGWHAGPHLFIDDKQIWAFSPLTAPGVHSPSWNAFSWGVEQLGDYDLEAYDTGRGALVKANTIAALAILFHSIQLDSSFLRLHKEDPLTTHKDCPGANCSNEIEHIKQAIHDYIVANLSTAFTPAHPANTPK
jgi:hypothetical protein